MLNNSMIFVLIMLNAYTIIVEDLVLIIINIDSITIFIVIITNMTPSL